MFSIGRLHGLFDRLHTYSTVALVVELLFIWIVVYAVVKFVQGTRAAGALKGVLVLMIFLAIAARVLGQAGAFQRLAFLYDKMLAFVAIGMIVIFQPELRRAVVRLGETSFFRSTPKDIVHIVDEISEAVAYLARAKFGAIIVIERQTGLSGVVEGGTVLNAELNSRLLQTIFFPGSALHDLAVIVKGRVIHSAGVQLPLAEPADMPDPALGSRHRAAVGVSKECDAIVVVVSEETGRVRIAERGRLSDGMSPAELRVELAARLTNSARRAARMVVPPEPMTAADKHAASDPAGANEASLAGFEMHDEPEDEHKRTREA
ncbi:MAG: diadenylate cyclase CdaA [Phycisphaerales bacterium]